MNIQRALIVVILLGISACNSRPTSSLPTPESAPTSAVVFTISPTEIPTAEIPPTIKATELLHPTPSPTKSPIPTTTLQLSGPYLGQEPPGLEPKIFAPGIISDPNFTEWSGAFLHSYRMLLQVESICRSQAGCKTLAG